MSTLYVDNLQPNLGSGVLIPGHVVQVVSAFEDGIASYSAASGGLTSSLLSVSITPKNASSKILVTGHISGSSDSKTHAFWIVLQRGGSTIGSGASAGNRRLCHSGFAQYLNLDGENMGHGTLNYLDSPNTTAQVTYSVAVGHNSGGSQTFNLNRTQIDNDSSDRPRAMSVITLMEIAQ